MEFVSKVARWPGKIHTAEYLRYPQLMLWEQALDSARKLGEQTAITSFYNALLPPVFDIVTKWELEGLPDPVTIDNLPGSPPLVAWLVDSVQELYRKTNEIDPN